MKRQDWLCIAAAFFVCTCAAHGAEQRYPTRAVRVVVPYLPGGNQDIVARVVGQKLSEVWGRPIVVDNRPGGGTNIGAELVVHAPPDGYTLFQGGIANAINMTLYRRLSYDFIKDFAPISLMTQAPTIFVVHPSVRATTVKELIALAKAQPGKLTYAAAGIGSSTHLTGELFKMTAGVDILGVPYKGGGGVVGDLIAGNVLMYFGTMPSALPHVKSGKLRALALMSDKRSPLLPSLPTIAEAGLPGMEISVWTGLMAPKATPQSIVAKVHTDVTRVLGLPDTREKLAVHGLETVGSTPAEYADFIKLEIAKYAKVIKFADIRPE